ncbi:hypothetical protein HBH98_203530 [Parastagonospora nodorum]|nr:hypothetical protein HBI09_226690 [Parastagonospora nodorum]KAH4048556.1 hypothetical protein HBH49_160180 [Parastagonospora nodorum]KAH4066654.1 hypothetical protein HBH50_141360 [Parastagonospora nodorum]KAH4086285.1 hypothetical protein HBH48_148630 [Parastagonospora nodorum]KAH4188759.1 hypothetical protein HBI95_229700 [Parastagonospora nodorum]
MQFTTTLVALLSAVSAVTAIAGTTADKPDVNSPEYQLKIKKLLKKQFPNGRPSTQPKKQINQSFGAFACAICAWGCGDAPGGWACDCCYPGGACDPC